MKERAFTFGSHGSLVGVLSEPESGPDSSRPTVLLFNVGVNHHVGPYRLNVDLARELADRGFLVLRFDLSGLGDSEHRRDARLDQERGATDLQEAMDFLARRRGSTRFLVVALCSGVDPAHAVAVTDARVSGAVFMDGYAYITPGYRVREAAQRAFRLLAPRHYRRWLQRNVLPRFGRAAAPEVGSMPSFFDRKYPPVETFRSDIESMLERGARLLFLYTRDAYFFNHVSQFTAMLGFRQLPTGIEVERLPLADHIFTATTERARVISRISAWMDSQFSWTAVASSAALQVASPCEKPSS